MKCSGNVSYVSPIKKYIACLSPNTISAKKKAEGGKKDRALCSIYDTVSLDVGRAALFF